MEGEVCFQMVHVASGWSVAGGGFPFKSPTSLPNQILTKQWGAVASSLGLIDKQLILEPNGGGGQCWRNFL